MVPYRVRGLRGGIFGAPAVVVGEEIGMSKRGVWARRLPIGDGVACGLAGSGVGFIASWVVSVGSRMSGKFG